MHIIVNRAVDKLGHMCYNEPVTTTLTDIARGLRAKPGDDAPRERVFADAQRLCNAFLTRNSLRAARYVAVNRVAHGGRNGGMYGWYYTHTSTVHVNLKNCKTPVRTPGYAWSFTGYKADLTVPGVTAHEVGHHVWDCLSGGVEPRASWMLELMRFERATQTEPSVSSYDKGNNLGEHFAEAMKLFILNPDLLACGRPMRYSVLRDVMGLSPVVDAKWREVLEHAHVKLVDAADRWIARGDVGCDEA